MNKIIYRKQEHIAYISLNRPEKLNAINREMVKELAKVWIDYRNDDDLWVAILSGEGKSFCSGADIKEMNRGKWQLKDSMIFGDERVTPSSYQIWKPIIAAIHGYAFGAGLLLALESDIRIASENALFGLPESKVNIPTLFAPFISYYIPQAIAAELMYTSQPLNVQRAYQLGIVNTIVSDNKLISTAIIVAKQICKNGPLSIWVTKELYSRGRNMNYDSAIALIEHIATPVMNSDDSIEAKRAFIEKRKPIWKLK